MIDDLPTTILSVLALLLLVYNAALCQWLNRRVWDTAGNKIRRRLVENTTTSAAPSRHHLLKDRPFPPPYPSLQLPKREISVRFSIHELTVTTCEEEEDSWNSDTLLPGRPDNNGDGAPQQQQQQPQPHHKTTSPCHRTIHSVSQSMRRKLTRQRTNDDAIVVAFRKRRSLRRRKRQCLDDAARNT